MGHRLLSMSWMAILSVLCFIPISGWAVVYVDVDNLKGPWDGNSWDTAYQNVQEGLDHAYAAGAEVWVAEGTYKPTSTTERTVSFQLRSGVALYGLSISTRPTPVTVIGQCHTPLKKTSPNTKITASDAQLPKGS